MQQRRQQPPGDEMFDRESNDASFKNLIVQTPQPARGSRKTETIKSNKVRDWQSTSANRSFYKNQSQLVVKAGRGDKVKAKEGGGSQSSISEAIFPELLNEQVSKYEEFMRGADSLVPDKILERPQRRLKAMEDFR